MPGRFAFALLGSALLSPALAQGASKLPPPVAAQYRCTVATGQVSVPLTINRTYKVWSNSFSLELGPTITNSVNLQLSPLGILKLDGKSKYTQLDARGKVIGQGTYTYDAKQNKPTFKGSVADNPQFKLAGYSVNSNGEISFTFAFGNQRHVCFTKVVGNPLPQKDRANGPLGGRILVSGGKDMEYDLVMGTQVWAQDGGTYVRLPGGLTLYTVHDVVREEGQLEFRNAASQPLGKPLNLPLNGEYVAVSHDGTRFLANVYIQGEVTANDPFAAMVKDDVWQLFDASGKPLARTTEQFLSEALYTEAVPAFLPDGRVLIPRKRENRTYLYSKDLQQAQPFAAGLMPAVSPNGQLVALLNNERTVTLLSAQGKEVNRLSIPEGIQVKAMTFSPDSQYLAFVIQVNPMPVYLAYASVKDRELSWLENRSGEALRLPIGAGDSFRISWWTGQSALPPAWKSGVPQNRTSNMPRTNGNTNNAGNTGNFGTTSTPPRTPPASREPASKTPWPNWLLKGTVTITGNPDLNGSVKLNLTRTSQNGPKTQIDGLLGDIDAAYRYSPGGNGDPLRLLLFDMGDNLYACLITEIAPSELQGELYIEDEYGNPSRIDGQCSIKP